MSFVTPDTSQTSTFKELQSKFISYIHPFDNVQSFKHWISDLRKEYHDADHVCWGYRIFSNHQLEENASDAGEPNGTAGLPIINAMKQSHIVNGGIAVVRFFGGTKLGKRGLIDAYGKGAKEVIKLTKLSTFVQMSLYKVTGPMECYGDLTQALFNLSGSIQEDLSAEHLEFHIQIPDKHLSELIQVIRTITKGKGDLIRL